MIGVITHPKAQLTHEVLMREKRESQRCDTKLSSRAQLTLWGVYVTCGYDHVDIDGGFSFSH